MQSTLFCDGLPWAMTYHSDTWYIIYDIILNLKFPHRLNPHTQLTVGARREERQKTCQCLSKVLLVPPKLAVFVVSYFKEDQIKQNKGGKQRRRQNLWKTIYKSYYLTNIFWTSTYINFLGYIWGPGVRFYLTMCYSQASNIHLFQSTSQLFHSHPTFHSLLLISWVYSTS